MGQLRGVVRELTPRVWTILRCGFTTQIEDSLHLVYGADDLDEVEELVTKALVRGLTPEARAEIKSEAGLHARIFSEARSVGLAEAKRRGREISLDEAAKSDASSVVNIDALIGGSESEPAAKPHANPELEARSEELLNRTRTFVDGLVERDKEVIALRWMENKSRLEVANHFTCGKAAVSERERRIRRKLRHALRDGSEGTVGPATADACLCGAPLGLAATGMTKERIEDNTLKATFIEREKPFAQRVQWAIGFAAFAFVLWLLQFLRVLPYYSDDVYPTPKVSVTCEGRCAPGGTAKIGVTAPRDASFVGFLWISPSGEVQPLLVDPYGRSLTLPFGAKETEVPVPYPATLPKSGGEKGYAVAVFSREELSAASLAKHAESMASAPGVLTASTAVSL